MPTDAFLVSKQVHGTTRFEEVPLRHHGTPAAQPVRLEHRPLPDFVDWDFEQVFKRELRPVA